MVAVAGERCHPGLYPPDITLPPPSPPQIYSLSLSLFSPFSAASVIISWSACLPVLLSFYPPACLP